MKIGGKIYAEGQNNDALYLEGLHGQPVGVHVLLLLEGPLEGVQDGAHREGAHCRPRDGVGGRGEDSVDQLVTLAAVHARDDVRG